MTWRPNRRFLRDSAELIRRGHDMTCAKINGRYEFFANGTPVTRKEIAEAAQWYRSHPVWTEAELTAAKARAEALYENLRLVG